MEFEEFKKEVKVLRTACLCYKSITNDPSVKQTLLEFEVQLMLQNAIRIVAEDVCSKLNDKNKLFLYWIFSVNLGDNPCGLKFPSDLKGIYDFCCSSEKPEIENWNEIIEGYIIPFELNDTAKNILKNISYEDAYKAMKEISENEALKIIFTHQTKYLED